MVTEKTKKYLTVIILSIWLIVTVGIGLELYINDNIVEDVACPEFNGRAFLLSGGTVTADTIEEMNTETSRLNWLCNGAK